MSETTLGEKPATGSPTNGNESPVDKRDVIFFVGVGLVGYGAFLIYPAAGFLAPGVILTGVSIFGVRG
jgi:hypothetical protein